MITPPEGFAVERTQDGLRLLGEGTVLEYSERQRPQRRAVELVRAYAADRGFALTRVGTPERFVTAEGEHAALVVAARERDGRTYELVFGFVFLDDTYAQLVCAGSEAGEAPRLHTLVKSLIIGDSHLLGSGRRRKFVYQAPAGWQGKNGLIETSWYPADYPSNLTMLTVSPALPAVPGLQAELISRVQGSVSPGKLDVVRNVFSPRLTGTVHHVLAANEVDVYLAMLTDGPYLYVVRLDVPRAARSTGLALLEKLLVSIEPVPRPVQIVVNRTPAVAHWVD